MKLGVFLPNGQNGYIVSNSSPQYVPTYQHMLDITKACERIGLDFILSMIKYRGFGGTSGYWESCLDSITLACGLAAETSTIELYATVPVLGIHPAVAARQISTFNDISKGRAGVNIVTGWNRPEYQQMGLWPGDDYHDRRYEYTEEYIKIMRTLWREGRMTFDGEFFKLTDCTCYPTPNREIPIVCAGQSPRGQIFTARHAEFNFVFGGREKLRRIAQPVIEESRKLGRDVGTLALVTVITEETDALALEKAQSIIHGADKEALANIARSASMDTNPDGTSKHFLDGLSAPIEEGNLAFMGFPVLHGSYETVAELIATLERDTGIGGLLLTFVDFVPDVERSGDKVLPLVRERYAAITRAA
jgi:pyrimidine oxygenase